MNHDLYIEQVQNFSKNLKYLRTKRGLSLTELSKKLDIPRGTMTVYETGYNLASICRMVNIAEFYGIEDYKDLLKDHEEFIKRT